MMDYDSRIEEAERMKAVEDERRARDARYETGDYDEDMVCDYDEETTEQLIADALALTDDEIDSVRTFKEDGVLTMDKGLVVTMNDGSEFQVTIKQSRRSR